MKRKRHRRKRLPGRTADSRVGEPDAPAEGADAGPDDDLRKRDLSRTIRDYRARATRGFGNAQRLLAEDRALAEREARAAIDAIVRAFWWAEGTDLEDAQHELMHRIGRWTRRTFGCHLDFDGQRYRQLCPIAIAHKRLGFSIGFIGHRTCSICGGDLSECPHIRGRSYWVRGGARDGIDCPVCLRPTCRHEPDRLYRVSVVSIIKHVDAMREVSLVGRPAIPEARLVELPIDTEALRRSLGPEFAPGIEVNCDLCLQGCWGFTEVPSDEAHPASR